MEIYRQEIYTQYLTKIVFVQFASKIIQIEFHVLIEEYFDFLINKLNQNYKNYLFNFYPAFSKIRNDSQIWNKNLLIKNVHNEKNPQSNMFLGDSWFNIVIDAIEIDDIHNINDEFDYAFDKQLDMFDNVFSYSAENLFEVNSNGNEINLLLNQTIKQIKTTNGNIIYPNSKIKKIVIEE